MKVDLDKKDLIAMVKGISPYYSLFNDTFVRQCGTYTGGLIDKWDWNIYKLETLTEKDLFGLYTLCKNSWR